MIRQLVKTISSVSNEAVPLFGNYLYVFSAAYDFEISFNDSSDFQWVRKGSVLQTAQDVFKLAFIRTATTQEIILKYGFGSYSETSSSPEVTVSGSVRSKPSSSTLPDNNDVTIASGATGEGRLIIAANERTRVTLQRVDSNSGVCRVWGSNVSATNGLQIAKDGQLSIETDSSLYCHNASGANVTFAIGEEI